MRLSIAAAALVTLVLLSNAPAHAAPGDGSFWDNFSVGTGIIHYNSERVYHATTRCRQLDFHNCGNASEGQPEDKVIVFRRTPNSAQLLLDYHPFGRPDGDSAWLSPERVSAQLVSSYGILSEDKKILEGAGLGYTLAAVDAFAMPQALTFTAGGVWLTDVHTLRPDDHPGHMERGQSPTEHAPSVAGMITLSLRL